MTPRVRIRPCRAEECEAVLALWQRAGAIPSPTDTLEELLRLVQSKHGDGFLVAVRDGVLVGSVIGGWDGWRGNIYRLAVAPEIRREGLAKELVTAAERVVWLKGARRMSALVERHEAGAIAFWDSLADAGYRRDPRMLRYVKALTAKRAEGRRRTSGEPAPGPRSPAGRRSPTVSGRRRGRGRAARRAVKLPRRV